MNKKKYTPESTIIIMPVKVLLYESALYTCVVVLGDQPVIPLALAPTVLMLGTFHFTIDYGILDHQNIEPTQCPRKDLIGVFLF